MRMQQLATGVLCVLMVLMLGMVPAFARGQEGAEQHAWLSRHRHQQTGLVQSFDTLDQQLHQQGATYDQALAGMMFLLVDDVQSAKNILKFFAKKWRGKGYPNFYNTQHGLQGIESTIHVGPNAWVGLLALAYERTTGDDRFWTLAESIAVWVAQLNHAEGAVAMGPRADWAADWTQVYSAENNLSYMALLNGLIALHPESVHNTRFASERAGIMEFLRTVAFRDVDACRVNTGYNEHGVDATQAFDVIPLAIMIAGPDRLRDIGIDLMQLVNCGEQQFATQDRIRGFDFTDAQGAKQAKRSRMISVEWTSMMIRAYRVLAEDAEQRVRVTGDPVYATQARALLVRVQILQDDLDRIRQQPAEDEICYPYATRSQTRVFPHSPWWKTPANGPAGLACSVAGTTWRYFAEHWDPFDWSETRALPQAAAARVPALSTPGS